MFLMFICSEKLDLSATSYSQENGPEPRSYARSGSKLGQTEFLKSSSLFLKDSLTWSRSIMD